MLRIFLTLGLVLACLQASDAFSATWDATHTHQIGLGGGSSWLVDSRNQPQPASFRIPFSHSSGSLFSFDLLGESDTRDSPVPFARARVTIDGSACVSCSPKTFLATSADIRVTLTYFVDVMGPAAQQGTVFVPVLATTLLTADLYWDNLRPRSSTNGVASVTYLYDGVGNGTGIFVGYQFTQVRTTSLDPISVSDLVDHTIMVPVPPGGFGTLKTTVSARALIFPSMNNESGSPSSAFWEMSAYADPYIRIDPSWEFADQYELDFSTGIGNVPVPEPSAALLLSSAVATLAFLNRATSARRLRSRAGRADY